MAAPGKFQVLLKLRWRQLTSPQLLLLGIEVDLEGQQSGVDEQFTIASPTSTPAVHPNPTPPSAEVQDEQPLPKSPTVARTLAIILSSSWLNVLLIFLPITVRFFAFFSFSGANRQTLVPPM